MQILWILNKYVDGGSLSRYYPDFLRYVEEEVARSGNKMHFIFFSDAMKSKAKTKNNFFYEPAKITKDVSAVANKIENEYQFTFKQAYFPDQIQVSKHQDYRKINLPEKEFRDLDFLVPRFQYLERIINSQKIDAVFCDQSPEVEMEFARAICLKTKKIFLRQCDSFLGKCLFYQQFEFGHERIAMPVLDQQMTPSLAKDFVDDFVENNRLPYQPRPYVTVNLTEFYLPRLLHFYRYPQFIKMALASPYWQFEEKILKKHLLESKFDKTKSYLFFGLHLPTEATVTLRSLPYMTQISIIESISRVLPYGYYLYVREHPGFEKHYPYSYLKRMKELPCVRLISPKVPIAEVIKNSRGILTFNATTGIEALMYGKPVLSFAPNTYRGHHPAADYCSGLFELGTKLVELINRPVNKQDTYQYIYQMFRSASDITIYAGTFLSDSDSAQKAPVFTGELLLSIDYCLKNAVSK